MSFLHHHKLVRRGGMEPETVATIARMSVKPNGYDATNYDEWIKAIKDGHGLQRGVNSLTPTFRLLVINACHHRQVAQLNWAMGPGFDGDVYTASSNSIGGTLGHLAYRWTTPQSTSFVNFPNAILDDAYILNAQAGQYSYDNGGFHAMGCGQTNGNYNLLYQRDATNLLARVHSIGNTVTGVHGSVPGIFAARRTGNTVSVWLNGVQKASTGGINSLGIIVTLRFACQALQRNGDAIGAVDGTHDSMHYYGVYAIDQIVMKNAIENFMAKYP